MKSRKHLQCNLHVKSLFTLLRTATCSDASLSNIGGRYVFNEDCMSLDKAILSSTLLSSASSRASDDVAAVIMKCSSSPIQHLNYRLINCSQRICSSHRCEMSCLTSTSGKECEMIVVVTLVPAYHFAWGR